MPSNNPAPLFTRADGDLQEASSFIEAWVNERLTVGSTSEPDTTFVVERLNASSDFVRFRRPHAGGYEFGVASAASNRAAWGTFGPGGASIFTSGWRTGAVAPGASYAAGVALHAPYHGGVGLEFDATTPQARLFGADLELTGALTVADDLAVEGNLYVNGTEFIVNTETLEVEDNLILINKGEVGPGVTAGTAGIEVDRGSADNYLFVFDETFGAFVVGLDGDTQPVATREPSPTGGGVAVWDSANNRFVTTNADMNTLADLSEADSGPLVAGDRLPFYSAVDENIQAFIPSTVIVDLLNADTLNDALGALGLDDLDGDYVAIDGDTMTGKLAIAPGSATEAFQIDGSGVATARMNLTVPGFIEQAWAYQGTDRFSLYLNDGGPTAEWGLYDFGLEDSVIHYVKNPLNAGSGTLRLNPPLVLDLQLGGETMFYADGADIFINNALNNVTTRVGTANRDNALQVNSSAAAANEYVAVNVNNNATEVGEGGFRVVGGMSVTLDTWLGGDLTLAGGTFSTTLDGTPSASDRTVSAGPDGLTVTHVGSGTSPVTLTRLSDGTNDRFRATFIPEGILVDGGVTLEWFDNTGDPVGRIVSLSNEQMAFEANGGLRIQQLSGSGPDILQLGGPTFGRWRIDNGGAAAGLRFRQFNVFGAPIDRLLIDNLQMSTTGVLGLNARHLCARSDNADSAGTTFNPLQAGVRSFIRLTDSNPVVSSIEEPTEGGSGGRLLFLTFTAGGTIAHNATAPAGSLPILCPGSTNLTLGGRQSVILIATEDHFEVLSVT